MSTFKQLLKASALAVCSVAVLVSTAQEQVKLVRPSPKRV